MDNTFQEKMSDFRNVMSDILYKILIEMTPNIEKNLGKDAATGFVLALDTVHMAIVGKDMSERVNKED